MKKRNNLIKNIFIIIFIILLIFFFLIYFIGYYSGSCYKKMDNYLCDNNFCLIKKMKIKLPDEIKDGINNLINEKINQKRVVIKPFLNIESIFDCAIPSKSGSTIPTQIINEKFSKLIDYYQNELCKIISNEINLNLKPTGISYPTTCSILIYDKEEDWINWHYDYNYYKGRFFTVLIPISNNITCTKYQYRIDNNIQQIDLVDDAIIFEGNYLYHNASKLCKNETRHVLSLQYVTDNSMTYLNKLRIKFKDYAYIGILK